VEDENGVMDPELESAKWEDEVVDLLCFSEVENAGQDVCDLFLSSRNSVSAILMSIIALLSISFPQLLSLLPLPLPPPPSRVDRQDDAVVEDHNDPISDGEREREAD
jgi:hypothetical protein